MGDRSPAMNGVAPPVGVSTNNSNIVPSYTNGTMLLSQMQVQSQSQARAGLPPSRTGDLRSVSNTPSAVVVHPQPGGTNFTGAEAAFSPSSRIENLNDALNEDSGRFRPVSTSQ